MSKMQVKLLTDKARVPVRATPGSAGYDLFSAMDLVIAPYDKALVGTHLSITVPPGTYGRIAPRSSSAWKNHIDVGAGVLDSDFAGHVHVVLFNHAETEFKIAIGDRIAQLIIEKIETPEIEIVKELARTERGEGGFGSTGKSEFKRHCGIGNIVPPI
jgi:dUTP pyrophosphatase